jgi:putative spermidine/putrescine transport system ATP-binding protein
MTMADTIVVMADGVVQQIGAPTEIYRNPANRFVAGFIGQSNLFEAEIGGAGHVRIAGRAVAVSVVPPGLGAGEPVALSIRPEAVRLRRGEAQAANMLPGRIDFIRDIGGSIEVRVACLGQDVVVTATPQDWQGFAVGEAVAIELPPAECRILVS